MWRGWERNCRASVAVWIAVMMPGLIMAVSLGVEVGSWAAAQVQVQRTADFSAISGGIYYKGTQDAQKAATFAWRMAQLNGAPAVTSPGWSTTCSSNTCGSTPCTGTLNNPTTLQNLVQVVCDTGMVATGDAMIKVFVPKTITAFSTAATVTGTGVAELVSSTGGGTGGQPCLVALSTSGQITGSGSTYLSMANCTIRSNGTIPFTGAGTVTAAGIYAGGAITLNPLDYTVTGTEYPNDGTIPDPYATNTTLQNEMSTAAGLTGVSGISCGTTQGVLGTAGQYTGNNNCNGTNALPNGGTCVTSGGVTCTMYPGNYSTWNVPSGGPYTFNMQPGLYLFSGAVTLTQNTTTNGTGVTIISAGSFTGSNTFNFNVTAPTPSEVSSTGGIAGIVLASASTGGMTLSGAVAFNVAGVVYFPNGTFNASGSSCSSGTSYCSGSVTCLEIIASSIELTGNANFNSSCSTYGATAFTSLSGTTNAQVVH